MNKLIAVALAGSTLAGFCEGIDLSVFEKVTDVQVSGAQGEKSIAHVAVPVRLSSSNINYADFSANGADLRVVDAVGNLLAHEIEIWDPTGESLVWVDIPELSTGGALIRLCHKAKTGAKLPEVSSADVWNAKYAGVWHFSDANRNGIADSSGKLAVGSVPHDVTQLGETGALGKGILISNSNAKGDKLGGVKLPTPSVEGNAFTVSCWVKHRLADYYYDHILFNKNSSSESGGGFALEYDGNNFAQRIFGNSGTWAAVPYDKDKLARWTHIAAVFNGANADFYVNGAYRGSASIKAASFRTDRPFAVGNDSDFADGGEDVSFKGWIDEVRVSQGAMGADEIATRYAAMAEPTFARVLAKLDTSVYQNRTVINVGGTKGEAVANVPVLVRLSTANVGFSYDTFAADGSDVRFADAEGHVLSHECVTWRTDGESQFWVMLPTLPVAGATFYLYHNLRDGVMAPEVDCSAMWQAGYRGVWHFDDATAIVDASGKAGEGAIKDADKEITLLGQDGKIGSGVRICDSTDDRDKTGGVFVPNFRHTSRFSVSAWFYHKNQNMYYDHLFYTKNKGSDDYGFAVELTNGGTGTRAMGYQSGKIGTINFPDKTWSSGKWAHVVQKYDGTNVTMYLNGVLRGTAVIDPARDGDLPLGIGNANTSDVSWKGSIDEVRVSYGGESDAAIDAKYRAMADASFVTPGPRETLGDGVVVYSLNVGFDARNHGRFAPEDYVDIVGYPARRGSDIAPLTDNLCTHPAPDAVECHGVYEKSLGWTFPGLRPNGEYEVRVHFLDGTYKDSGKRVQNIVINGETKVSGIDVADLAGNRTRCAVEVSARGVADDLGCLVVKVEATVDNAQVHAIEVVDPAGDGTPLKPIVRSVVRTASGTRISLASQTGLTTYEIRRRLAGGTYETVATGVPQDCLLVGETESDWLYSARATADGKTGAWSDEAAVRVLDAADAPKSWVGLYAPQSGADFSDERTGRLWRSYQRYPNAAISWSKADTMEGAWLDLPETVRKGGLAYGAYHVCITNLVPSAHYTLKLYTGELYYGATAKRQGYLTVNNDVWESQPVDFGIDYFAWFGRYRTGCLEYETVSDHLGRVFIRATNQTDNNQLQAMELTLADADGRQGAMLTARNAQTDRHEGEILSTTAETLSFDWTDGAPDGAAEDGNEIVLAGCVNVSAAETYTFSIEQNGNGFLYVDDVPLATVFGSGAQTANGSRELCAGTHTIRYRVNQRGGVAKGAVYWQTASGSLSRQVVGGVALRQPKAVIVGNDDSGKWRLRHVNTYRQGADVYPIGTAPDNGSTRYRMVSTGVNYWTTNEHYPFFSQKVRGDGSLTVRLVRMQGFETQYTSFGLMMRTSDGSSNMDWNWCLANHMETGAASGNVNLTLRARGDADASNGRSVANLVTLNSADQKEGDTLVGINLPLWYKMTRKGASVAMYWSRDGKAWREISTHTVPGSDAIYIGVTALANASGAPEYEFDSLKSTFRNGFIIQIR